MMGSVPLLLDKSAFQALSAAEHRLADHFFISNVTPVLVNEIVADIKKQFPPGQIAEERVAQLAKKFFGSGTAVSMGYRTLLMGDLDGAVVPMTGQIIPENAISMTEADGSESVLVDIGPANMLILRLASSQATNADRSFADAWRATSANLSLSGLHAFIYQNGVTIARARTLEELSRSVDEALDNAAFQESWFLWALGWIRNDLLRQRIGWRWSGSAKQLRSFAPYAYHCLRGQVLLHAGGQFNLIPKWKSTHLIDLQYLYYLPFCGVFVSDDRLHRALGPLMCRPDQRFVRLQDFKRGLALLATHLKADDGVPSSRTSDPPRLPDNPATEAWHHLMTAWDARK